MSSTLLGMLLAFISMLPYAPVRAYVSPQWQHLLTKGWQAFIGTCVVLFVATVSTSLSDVIVGAAGITLAWLLGFGVSAGLTKLALGKLPELKNPLTDEHYVDPLFDWSREAIKYKLTRIALPNACGIALACVLYMTLR